MTNQSGLVIGEGPAEIVRQQVILNVNYLNFNNISDTGQIIIHHDLAQEVREWFELALRLKFPIEKVQPASDYNGDDNMLMAKNISSGFNYRKVAGTTKLSLHSLGRAFDVNPRQNPYIRQADRLIVSPPDAQWEPAQPGTLNLGHELVKFMISRGWIWGGNWSLEQTGRVDYQHFEKQG